LASTGCSPALNWRVVPVDASLAALFPCRVERRERAEVPVANQRLTIVQWSCESQSMTFVLNAVPVVEPAVRATVAEALRAAALDNAGGRIGRDEVWKAPEALSVAGARRVAVQRGRVAQMPGRAVDMELLTLVRGSSVYQMAVVGERLESSAVDAFFEGLAPLR
jgi:hypothetical protein